ncbi:MAG TPA: hypothetical protein VFS32_06335 [Candidatus Limnocylindrales bacterium]|nr:hypothetical protein [Candidatus Limnocylindrales bacterium]
MLATAGDPILDGLEEVASEVHVLDGREPPARPIERPIDLLVVSSRVGERRAALLPGIVAGLAPETIACLVEPIDAPVEEALGGVAEPHRRLVRLRLRYRDGVLRAVGPANASGLLELAAGARGTDARPRSWLARLRPSTRGRGVVRDVLVRVVRVAGPAGVEPDEDREEEAPEWLTAAARSGGVDIRGWSWALSTGGAYPTQKLVWYLGPRGEDRPALVVKQTRNVADNRRLEREFEALRTVGDLDLGPSTVVPSARFVGRVGDRLVVGESAVAGVDIRSVVRPGTDDPALRAVVDWLTRQALLTRRAVAPGAWSAALGELLARCEAAYALAPSESAALRASIDRLDAAGGALAAVFGHGDAGAHNILATPDGRIAPLDWEGAEDAWPPTWDLIYFLRSYAGTRPRFGATSTARHHLIDGSRLTPALGRALAAYVADVGVPADLLVDLFHTCWMHRAVKEAARLPPARRDRGSFVRLLRAGLAAPRIALVEAARAR